MLLRIIGFELKCRLRQPGLYLTVAAMMALGAYFAYSGTSGPAGGAVHAANQPYEIALTLTLIMLIGAYLPLSQFAEIVRRDATTGMADLVRATPARDWVILLGRFVATFILLTVAFAAAIAAFEIMCHMPWVDAKLVGPFQPVVYGRAFLLLVLPTLLCFAGLSVFSSALTRSAYAPFLMLIAIYLLYATSWIAFKRLGSQTWLSLLDPSAFNAFVLLTAQWTNIEKATLALPYDALLLMNRYFWSGIGLAGLAASCAFATRRDGSRWLVWLARDRASASVTKAIPAVVRPPVAATPSEPEGQRAAAPIPRPVVTPAASPVMAASMLRLRFELGGLLRGWLPIALLVLPALIAWPTLYFGGSDDGLALLPVTASVAPKLTAAAVVPMLLFCVLFAGEMVWRERSARMSEIIDATTTPGLINLGAKLGALAVMIAIQLAVLAAIGIGYQLLHGAPQINLSYYAAELIVGLGWPLLLIAVVAMLVQALVPNRMLAHLVALGLVTLLISAQSFGVEHRLLRFADTPDITLSDMNGIGHYLKGPLWLMAYWTCVSFILFLLADLLRERAVGTPLAARLRNLRHAPKQLIAAATAALVLAAGLAGFIIGNLHFINEYTTTAGDEKKTVEYERLYGALVDSPQPRVTAVDTQVDLVPERRAFNVRGRMTLQNTTAQPINTFHVIADADDFRLAMAEPTVIERPARGSCCDVHVVRLATPMQPGDKLELNYTAAVTNPGFRNSPDSSGIRHNGTFINNSELMPSIGFNRNSFLQDERRRLAFGLKPLDDTPAPGDARAYRSNYISQDADFIDFAITVSTSPDQIAIAPGYLQREWMENGRRHFRYEMDRKIVNFWSVVSGRYAIARDKWNDVELSVHHHPTHSANVPAMLDAMKLALAYASEAFSPFQYRQIRIVEFPYANFAQSFPNTVPFSENAGFITDPSATSGFTLGVTDITAHEVAHQWWAHQIISADVPGAVLLSETLAEYTMLMVMKRRFGVDAVRRLIKRDAEKYLKSRGSGTAERPLARVKRTQSEIAYQKGGIAMYALQLAAGEAVVNKALGRLIREYGGKSDPYPSAADLVRLLKEEAGPKHHELIADLFERITLWDFQALAATKTKGEDGKWKVRFRVQAKKLDADENGAETERTFDQSVEVALYKADPASAGTEIGNRVGVFLRRLRTGNQWLEMITDKEPAYVAVNPFRTLIQRETGRNAIVVVQATAAVAPAANVKDVSVPAPPAK